MAEAEQESVVKPRRKWSTQREMAMRDARLIRALATGQSIEELAAQEGVSLRRARERVSAILSRTADPPAEFAQSRARRLSEAMIVAYATLNVGDLSAIDRVIRVTREFGRRPRPALAVPAPPAAPAQQAKSSRPEMTPQRPNKIDSAPEIVWPSNPRTPGTGLSGTSYERIWLPSRESAGRR